MLLCIKTGVRMIFSKFLFLAILVTSNSYARTSFKIKEMRVASLMELQKEIPSIAFEAYARELKYESQNLSIESRVKNETNLLTNKIKNQVSAAYTAALSVHGDSRTAREEVKNKIEADLELANPELKEELLNLANSALNSIESGEKETTVNLEKTESVLKTEVELRLNYLNESEADASLHENSDDKLKTEYKTTAELMESLTSDRANAPWISTSNQSLQTTAVTSKEILVSLQVKFEFLGADIEAGPSISFRKEFTTRATISAEGLEPILNNLGNFDYWKRDRNGSIKNLNGKNQKRYINFSCDANLSFSTLYNGAGGFKYMGMGANANISKNIKNEVTLESRTIKLPEFVEGKSMTVQYLSQICNTKYLNAKYNSTTTVSQTLNSMMKNIVASLTFTHPKNKCAQDFQCNDWYDNKIISLVKINNVPRCAEDKSLEKFRTCQLRGLEGQNCPVIEKGKRLSDGQFEYSCDQGLQCVKSQDQSTFLGAIVKYAKGTCKIKN
jgi:hypothetical protein